MDLEGLQQLQEIDIQRDEAKRELQTILDQIADPPFVPQLDAEIEAQAEEARRADNATREAHAIVQTAQRRIEVTDNRLYSGSITDHRTLESCSATSMRSVRHSAAGRGRDAASYDAQMAHEAGAWLSQLKTSAVDAWNARQSELERSAEERRTCRRVFPPD